jgi:hypothetical protein
VLMAPARGGPAYVAIAKEEDAAETDPGASRRDTVKLATSRLHAGMTRSGPQSPVNEMPTTLPSGFPEQNRQDHEPKRTPDRCGVSDCSSECPLSWRCCSLIGTAKRGSVSRQML